MFPWHLLFWVSLILMLLNVLGAIWQPKYAPGIGILAWLCLLVLGMKVLGGG